MKGAHVAGPWISTNINGVVRRTLTVIGDERGSFTELWRASLTPDSDETLVQANLSRSRAGVLRGMHYHHRQVDLWIVVDGRALAATTDLRDLAVNGATSATSQVIEMNVGDALYIPRLVAHGFWAIEDLSLLYLVSSEYDGSDESGFAWNDPDAAIAWPSGEPVLSERDRNNPALADVASHWTQHSPST